MLPPDHEFSLIDQFLGGYFHQDMDIISDSVPEVVSVFARECPDEGKHRLILALDKFEHDHKGDLDAAFVRVFNLEHEINPVMEGQDTAGFFAMVRAILADPSVYRDFEGEEGGA